MSFKGLTVKKNDTKNTKLRTKHSAVSIAVIGKGRLGSTFAQAIASHKHSYQLFAHLSARSTSFKILNKKEGPEVVMIVCSDKFIPMVAQKVIAECGKNLKLIIHSAGALPSDTLPKQKGISRLMLHPIQTFATIDTSLLRDITFGAETSDDFALKFAKQFIKVIGASSMIRLRAEQLPLYHTMMTVASNFSTLLGGAVEMMGKSLKIDKKILKKAVAPLMRRSLKNVLNNDAKQVLTGPIARKDYTTILKHRLALKSQPLALRKIYEGFVMLAEEL